jgi:DNA replication protein DnaC
MKSISEIINSIFDMNEIHKDALRKMYPKLREVNFEVEIRAIDCERCKEKKAKPYQNKVFLYWIKTEDMDEFQPIKNQKRICSTCEMEIEVDKWAEQEEQRRRELFMQQYTSIPRELESASFENFQLTEANTELYKTARTYVKDFLSGKRYSLYLYGTYGVGKSHAAKAIYEEIKAAGKLVGFMTTTDLLAKIKETYKRDAELSESQVFQHLKAFDLFVLDEIGAESQGVDVGSWTSRMMIAITNSLLGVPTIYTSNFSLDELEQILDGRTVDRLYSNTKRLEVRGTSWRRKPRG